MKNKWIFFGILIFAEILVLTAIVMVVWTGVTETNLESFGFRMRNPELFSAGSEEEWSFEADEIFEVNLESSGGDVSFETTQSETILVTAYKTAWHSSKAKAQAELEDLNVTVSQTGNKIAVKYRREPSMFIIGQHQSDTVDFIISVPEGFLIGAQIDFGDITLSGKLSDSEVSTNFGDIEINEVKGNLDAKSNSGDINVTNIKSEDIKIDLNSDFGDIALSSIQASSILVHSNSGSVIVNNVQAKENIIISSDFGKLEFKDGSSDILSMITNSGKILVSNASVESNLTVQTDFGDIELEKTTADIYDIDTNSGKLRLDIIGGNLKAVSDFGDIDVQSSQPATIDLFTKSGSVDYSGPLDVGPHSLVTNFGDINMYLPNNTAITFDLETDFGKVRTEFPITLEGDVKQDHWTGTINDGGAELSANTNSGDISFIILNR